MLTVDNNNRLPSNPSQASLQEFMLSSETSRSIFKGKHRKASAASQNRSLKFKEEPDEITQDGKKDSSAPKTVTRPSDKSQKSQGATTEESGLRRQKSKWHEAKAQKLAEMSKMHEKLL